MLICLGSERLTPFCNRHNHPQPFASMPQTSDRLSYYVLMLSSRVLPLPNENVKHDKHFFPFRKCLSLDEWFVSNLPKSRSYVFVVIEYGITYLIIVKEVFFVFKQLYEFWFVLCSFASLCPSQIWLIHFKFTA